MRDAELKILASDDLLKSGWARFTRWLDERLGVPDAPT
ncbi:hypothetical protein HNP52_004404 [Sphingomonas kyeonggiensis]|uniref:Uncharacterized protein n=2 Tax=Sphingomonas kyeonggiensis TaxID=1268553 RepID=A0A7W7K5U9_9SPHN|nr:hypothetical protein [Sphingomonas kyeonggiensis]MBB4841302.1 hypothetical protein [Sphingomonas kyeonggiensis]